MLPCNRSSSPHANSLLLKCPKIPFWTGNFVADSLRELHPQAFIFAVKEFYYNRTSLRQSLTQ